MGRLFFLAKFFQEGKHADDFLGGMLYANKLSYFKNIEKCVDRGDEYEGGIFLRPHGLVIKLKARNPVTGEIREFEISEHDLAGPMIVHPRWFDHIHLFCMYACHTGALDGVAVQDVHELKKHLEIPEDCARLGTHAVVITHGKKFLGRIVAGAKVSGYKVKGGLVKYYDAGEGIDLPSNDIDTIFYKRQEYEYQREYRIAIDTGTVRKEPIYFCIEPIYDIAIRMNTDEINRNMKVSENFEISRGS